VSGGRATMLPAAANTADVCCPMVDADPTDYMIYVPALSWRRFFTFIRLAKSKENVCFPISKINHFLLIKGF